MRAVGRWLSLGFILLTLLGGGLHHHAREELEATARPEKGCGDSCTHFAGHDAPDLGRFGADCPACHLQSERPGLLANGVPFSQHVRTERADRPQVLATVLRVAEPTTRAPPLARA